MLNLNKLLDLLKVNKALFSPEIQQLVLELSNAEAKKDEAKKEQIFNQIRRELWKILNDDLKNAGDKAKAVHTILLEMATIAPLNASENFFNCDINLENISISSPTTIVLSTGRYYDVKGLLKWYTSQDVANNIAMWKNPMGSELFHILDRNIIKKVAKDNSLLNAPQPSVQTSDTGPRVWQVLRSLTSPVRGEREFRLANGAHISSIIVAYYPENDVRAMQIHLGSYLCGERIEGFWSRRWPDVEDVRAFIDTLNTGIAEGDTANYFVCDTTNFGAIFLNEDFFARYDCGAFCFHSSVLTHENVEKLIRAVERIEGPIHQEYKSEIYDTILTVPQVAARNNLSP